MQINVQSSLLRVISSLLFFSECSHELTGDMHVQVIIRIFFKLCCHFRAQPDVYHIPCGIRWDIYLCTLCEETALQDRTYNVITKASLLELVGCKSPHLECT